jgi:hypothetical protein
MKAVGTDLLKVVDTLNTDQLKKAATILGISPDLLSRDDGKPLQPVRSGAATCVGYAQCTGWLLCSR